MSSAMAAATKSSAAAPSVSTLSSRAERRRGRCGLACSSSRSSASSTSVVSTCMRPTLSLRSENPLNRSAAARPGDAEHAVGRARLDDLGVVLVLVNVSVACEPQLPAAPGAAAEQRESVLHRAAMPGELAAEAPHPGPHDQITAAHDPMVP